MLPSSCCHIYKPEVKFHNFLCFNQITICQAQVICASDRLVVINFLSPSLLLKIKYGDFFQGLWGVTWQPIDNLLPSGLSTGEKVMQDDEFTCDLFRFLQLLCEGHNSGWWAGCHSAKPSRW